MKKQKNTGYPVPAKRQQIVAASLKLFCENGFQQTATANISKEAGVATGTLFLYFKSKDELINSIYKECKQQMAAALLEGLPVTKGTQVILKHIWTKAIEWALGNRYAFQFIHMCKASPVITNNTREEIASTHGFAHKLFDDAFRSGELTKMDKEMFFTLFDGLYNATINYLILTNLRNKKKITAQTFAVFWKGVSI